MKLMPNPTVTRPDVTITFTAEEADILCDLMGLVGGKPDRPFRSCTDRFAELLREDGQRVEGLPRFNGNIWSKD